MDNMNGLKIKTLEFLHGWLNDNKIAQIRKGMPEDLENLILSIIADAETQRSAERMVARSEEIPSNEEAV